jgi:hypothetical protein
MQQLKQRLGENGIADPGWADDEDLHARDRRKERRERDGRYAAVCIGLLSPIASLLSCTLVLARSLRAPH